MLRRMVVFLQCAGGTHPAYNGSLGDFSAVLTPGTSGDGETTGRLNDWQPTSTLFSCNPDSRPITISTRESFSCYGLASAWQSVEEAMSPDAVSPPLPKPRQASGRVGFLLRRRRLYARTAIRTETGLHPTMLLVPAGSRSCKSGCVEGKRCHH